MAGITENEESITGINVTPLVDIVLVLLIIFMATAHLIAHRSLNLSLPRVAHSQETPTPSQHVTLSADKTLRLNQVKVTPEELALNLGQMAHADPNVKVTLGADKQVSWGDVAHLLDLLKGAGVSKVATEVEPK